MAPPELVACRATEWAARPNDLDFIMHLNNLNWKFDLGQNQYPLKKGKNIVTPLIPIDFRF